MHHIVKLFDCTAYWPFELKALDDGSGVPMTVERDAGMLVAMEDLTRAKIEASARLDLSAWDPAAGSIGLGWNKRRWKSWPWAPYGIGSRVNALVPWRDVASNSLPFGAQLVFPLPMRSAVTSRPIASIFSLIERRLNSAVRCVAV
jgi:hypothetical protein